LYSPVQDAGHAHYGGVMLYTEIRWMYREKFYSDADIIFKQLRNVCERKRERDHLLPLTTKSFLVVTVHVSCFPEGTYG
jgi:hypothetical protein